jgi:hypothetical protein
VAALPLDVKGRNRNELLIAFTKRHLPASAVVAISCQRRCALIGRTNIWKSFGVWPAIMDGGRKVAGGDPSAWPDDACDT